MPSTQNLALKIQFNDPTLDDEDRDRSAQYLMAELNEMDTVSSVSRVLDPHPPEGNKSFGAFIVGLLQAEVSLQNAKGLLTYLGERLGNKPIELEVEHNGKKLKVKAHGREELKAAIQEAKDFLEA
jgi:hypothetical protein